MNGWASAPNDPTRVLVSKASAGDRQAFDRLVSFHRELLRGYIAMRVGHESADDVLQEVWTACWMALPTFRSRSGFKAWLYGIACNKCADHHRAQFRTNTQSLDELSDLSDPDDAYARIEVREVIRTAMTGLPTAQKEVLELYYYAGLTLPEIAQSVKRNLNTVKYQFYRAHDQVAQALRDARA